MTCHDEHLSLLDAGSLRRGTCSSNTPAADSGSKRLSHRRLKGRPPLAQHLGRGCRQGKRAPDQVRNRYSMALGDFDVLNFAESRATEPLLEIDAIAGLSSGSDDHARRMSWNLPVHPCDARALRSWCRKSQSSHSSSTIRSSTARVFVTIEPMQRAADGHRLKDADVRRADPRSALGSGRGEHPPEPPPRAPPPAFPSPRRHPRTISHRARSRRPESPGRIRCQSAAGCRPAPARRHLSKEAGWIGLAIARVKRNGRIKTSHKHQSKWNFSRAGVRVPALFFARSLAFSKSFTSTPAKISAAGRSYCCRWLEG